MGIEYVGVFSSSPPFTPIVSVLVATSSRAKHAAVCATVFESPGWAAVVEEERTKLELKSGAHMYCIERAGTLFCLVAVVGDGTGTRFIFSGSNPAAPRFMNALKAAVRDAGGHEGANAAEAARAIKRNLKSSALAVLAKRFGADGGDTESVDKVVATQRKVETLKTTMHAKLIKATERDMLIDALDDKARDLRSSAKDMFLSSKTIQNAHCWRYTCCAAGVTVFTIVVAAIIILCLNHFQFHWW